MNGGNACIPVDAFYPRWLLAGENDASMIVGRIQIFDLPPRSVIGMMLIASAWRG